MADVLARARALYDEAHHADELGRFDEALTGFRAALRLLDAVCGDVGGGQGGQRDLLALRVRSLLGVARAVFESSGDLAGAMDVLRSAEGLAVTGDLVTELVAVQGQRGLLYLRSGDPDAALVAFDAVDPGPGAPPSRDLAVTLLNRGVLLLDRDQQAAARDLDAAAVAAAGAGKPNTEAAARHNLGWLRFLQGDLPAALREMSDAADLGSIPEPVALLDRARVLAGAGLVNDAVAALESAVDLLDGGSVVVRAEVDLALAACLLDLRRYERAIVAAQEAATVFRGLGNETWALSAQAVELGAVLAQDRFVESRAPVTTLRARAARAAALAEAGRGRGLAGRLLVEYPALVAAAEWAVLAGDVEAGGAHLDRVPGDLGSAPLALRLTRVAVAARLEFAAGRRTAGVDMIRHGQRELAAYRGLGSVEAVAASGLHALHLNLVDTEAALDTGDPVAIFDALERGRATAAGAARLVPPDDEVLAGLLAQARAEHQASLALGSPADAAGLSRKRGHVVRARALQARARERSWTIEGERRPVPAPTVGSLRSLLATLPPVGRPVIVSFVVFAGEVLAVRVDDDGASLLRLADRGDVVELTRRARADLEIVAGPRIPRPLHEAAVSSLRRTLTRLDELLVAPLDARGNLHVVARGGLLTLPWSALPSRVGRGTWVNDHVELRREFADLDLPGPGGVVAVAGPGTGGADVEAAAVARVWPQACLLTGAEAMVARTTEALRAGAVVHLAAHGGHVADNPLFSTLRLADGPLFAHELDGVDLTGAVVVLSACELGRSSSDVGGENLGFASVLLRQGARAVVAAVAPLSDEAATDVMPRFHEFLRDGLQPGAALAAAAAGWHEPVPLVSYGPVVA